MDEPPLTEGDQLELVKHQINKMVDWGVFTPPADSLALTSATTASDFLQVQAGDDATTATFSEPGVYEVMLGGYDGDVAADFVIVTVEP